MIADFGEIADHMLPYTEKYWDGMFEDKPFIDIVPSEYWYEEREDFSRNVIGTDRVAHRDMKGFQLLQGQEQFRGRLLGGCLESMYGMISDERHLGQSEICEKYKVFPDLEMWRDAVLFLETCEEKPNVEMLKKELTMLKRRGIFDVICGIIVGKPQDETYYEEYKKVYPEVIQNDALSVVYNVNFGHASPRCILPYGCEVCVDTKHQRIQFMESPFRS